MLDLEHLIVQNQISLETGFCLIVCIRIFDTTLDGNCPKRMLLSNEPDNAYGANIRECKGYS